MKLLSMNKAKRERQKAIELREKERSLEKKRKDRREWYRELVSDDFGRELYRQEKRIAQKRRKEQLKNDLSDN